jgi:hypothetical protein
MRATQYDVVECRKNTALNVLNCTPNNTSNYYHNYHVGATTVIGLMIFGTALFCPPLKWLLATYMLPSPGQGPSEATMDKGD